MEREKIGTERKITKQQEWLKKETDESFSSSKCNFCQAKPMLYAFLKNHLLHNLSSLQAPLDL